jgi:F-type H+-transporting ATPase subunit epsilon
MRLRIVTPGAVVVDEAEVAAVRAEDASGAFGVWPRHADFLTVLVPSVLGWRTASGVEGHCAVRGGLFTVGGGEVSVATREAVVGDDLDRLQALVSGRLARDAAAERAARARSEQLRIQAIRQMVGYLRPRSGGTGDLR